MRVVKEDRYKEVGPDKYETVEVDVEYPNEFEANGLFVRKYSDGSHNFQVNIDYDYYDTTITDEQAQELAKFLAEPYYEGY